MEHPLGSLMEKTMTKIREMVDVNTIIGEPITTQDGTTIIPVSKVSFGFTSGGSDFGAKGASENQQLMFGGGSGAGVSITPIAFLIAMEGSVKLLPVAGPPNTTVDRVIETIPEVVDKITEYLEKNKKKKRSRFDEEMDD